jgi:hypothetical protein
MAVDRKNGVTLVVVGSILLVIFVIISLVPGRFFSESNGLLKAIINSFLIMSLLGVAILLISIGSYILNENNKKIRGVAIFFMVISSIIILSQLGFIHVFKTLFK